MPDSVVSYIRHKGKGNRHHAYPPKFIMPFAWKTQIMKLCISNGGMY